MKRNRKTLGELCSLEKGTSAILRTPPGAYPLVTTGEERKTAESYQFDGEAVCIPTISSTGHGHASLKRVHYQAGRFALGNLLVAGIVKDPSVLSTKFLARYLMFVKDRLIVPLMTGAANMSISLDRLASVPIDYPCLNDQERIVRLLDEVDAIRGLRSGADERMRRLVPSIFHDMFGESRLDEKKWDVATIGEVSSFVTSGSRGWAGYYADKGARFLRVQNLAGHRLNFDDAAFVNPPESAEARRTRVQAYDLLLAITGNTIGLSGIVPENIGEAYVSQHVAIIRPNNRVDPNYLAVFMATENGAQRQICDLQYGQTKPGLSLGQVRGIRLPVPPMSLQRRFSERLEEVLLIEGMQDQSRRVLGNLYESTMFRAFAGAI